MKYTKGTPTLLGKIEEADTSYTLMPYLVNRDDKVGHWFTESEIDAIIIKPKRNIDHLIELWDGCERNKAFRFMYENIEWDKRTLYNVMFELFQPYIEPRKYPVLTPEELKAVKWLVGGGFKTIHRCMGGWATVAKSENLPVATEALPIASFLNSVAWITETPINLKELLEAQEDV